MSENYIRDDSPLYSFIVPPSPNPNLACTDRYYAASHSVRNKIFKICVNIIIGLLLAISDLDGVFMQLIYVCGTAVYVISIYWCRKNHKIDNIYWKI